MHQFGRVVVVLLLGMGLLAGCVQQGAHDKSSMLTPGMTKKFIYPGRTMQTEVLEIFGPPDLVTRRDGREVWTYDKISQEVSSSQGFLTILIAGLSRERFRSNNRSIMLIVYFNRKEIVKDYKLSAARF